MDPDLYSRKPAPKPVEELPLFQHPADYAEPAAQTDDGEELLSIAKRAANAIMDAQGTFCMWEVRIELGKLGLLANDGHEKLDGLGSVGRRMSLVPVGRERPPAWALKLLPAGHANVNTRWARPGSPEASRKSA